MIPNKDEPILFLDFCLQSFYQDFSRENRYYFPKIVKSNQTAFIRIGRLVRRWIWLKRVIMGFNKKTRDAVFIFKRDMKKQFMIGWNENS